MEENISFLIAQVCKAHRNTANALLQERLELYAGQDMFLNFLAQHDGASQSDLAQSLCVEAPTITRMVQRLGQAELVERSTDPDDARVTRLHVTAKGRTAVSQMEEVWQDIEARAIANLNTEECAQLRHLLTRIRDNLTQP